MYIICRQWVKYINSHILHTCLKAHCESSWNNNKCIKKKIKFMKTLVSWNDDGMIILFIGKIFSNKFQDKIMDYRLCVCKWECGFAYKFTFKSLFA